MIREYLVHVSPLEALKFVSTNKYLYNQVDLFKYLMSVHYPTVPFFNQPKEQFIALANGITHTYYIIWKHLDSIKCPEMLGKHLYLTRTQKMIEIDEESEDESESILKVNVVGLKPPIGTVLYVSMWVDYAYGESVNNAYTIEDIVNMSINQLESDYNVNQERKEEFTYVKASKKSMMMSLEDGRYCLVLHEHPLDEDYTPPVLTIQRVIVV